MRTFIAIDIDEKVRALLGDIISRLKKGIQFTGATPSWVPIENIHLTLQFLGEIEEGKIAIINDLLKEVASETKSFEINVEKLGVFPNRHSPKVLWIGINEGKDEAINLQQKVVEKMKKLGFAPESRPFSPHLTLARIKSLRGTKGMMDVITSHSNFSAGRCLINELILFKSILYKTGAEYTPLIKIPFNQ